MATTDIYHVHGSIIDGKPAMALLGGADNGTIVGAVVHADHYCEFESRFRTKGFVTADYPIMTSDGTSAHCIVIKAA